MAQATRAADFLETMAVNGHWSHGTTQGTQYTDAVRSVEALQYLGIHHVRDSVPVVEEQFARFDILADAGIKFDLFPRGTPADVTVDMANQVEARNPGSVVTMEGPNEVDIWVIDNPEAFQEDYYNRVKADPLLGDVPVVDYSIGAELPTNHGKSDIANFHAYRPWGDQPSFGLQWHLDFVEANNPGDTLFLTETGYPTAPAGERGQWQGVDELSAAKMILNTYFRAEAEGIDRTFVYQLLDHQPSEPGDADLEKHLGFFDTEWNPKPAGHALHNLTTIIKDGAGNARDFTPGTLDYTLSGDAPNLASKLLQEADGTFNLVVWAEPDIWDSDANVPIAAPVTPITVTLDKAYASLRVYDPLLGTTAIKTASDTGTITLDVTDHPLILEVSGAGTPTTPAPTPVPTPTPSPEPSGEATALVVGSGPDSLVLKVTQDRYLGDAQYTVSVDGAQVGGTLTASALRGSGQADTVTVRGDWGPGEHAALVTFVNDAWGGTPDTDRNLYVEAASYNGQALPGDYGGAVDWRGGLSLGFAEPAEPAEPAPEPTPATPVELSAGTGSDALVLKISQDEYKGSAQYTVSVDGAQVGGTFTASASRAAGQSDTLTLKGDWAAGEHTVAVTFLNDAWDGTPATDRNLWVDSATYNGQALPAPADNGAVHAQGGISLGFTEPAEPAPEPVAKVGTDGSDVLDGDAADGVLTGKGGRDFFVLEAGDGHATVTDFTTGTDKLVFLDLDREDVATAAATEGGVSGLLVSYEGGGGVFLAGVSELAARDMVFA